MRLGVLYKTTDGPWGGGNSFLRSLKRALIRQGVDVTDSVSADLDGVLINSSNLGAAKQQRILTPDMMARLIQSGYWHPVPNALRLSRWNGSRPPFVHRLDGVFRLYGRSANDAEDKAQAAINRFVDHTIYQSEYCRESFAGEGVDVSRSTVIFNGVDTERFFPLDQLLPRKPLKLVCVSWSSNVRKGAPYAAQASQIPGVEVTFIGRWPQDVDPANVRVIPPLSHEELPSQLRQHHAMLHMAQNDPCSNAILEGLASGLPVIFHPSGGSPEIVGSSGLPGEPDLPQTIAELQDCYDELRSDALSRRETLSIDHAARLYAGVFANRKRVAL